MRVMGDEQRVVGMDAQMTKNNVDDELKTKERSVPKEKVSVNVQRWGK